MVLAFFPLSSVRNMAFQARRIQRVIPSNFFLHCEILRILKKKQLFIDSNIVAHFEF